MDVINDIWTFYHINSTGDSLLWSACREPWGPLQGKDDSVKRSSFSEMHASHFMLFSARSNAIHSLASLRKRRRRDCQTKTKAACKPLWKYYHNKSVVSKWLRRDHSQEEKEKGCGEGMLSRQSRKEDLMQDFHPWETNNLMLKFSSKSTILISTYTHN